MAVILLATYKVDVSWKLRSTCAATDGDGSRLDANLVPKVLDKERLERPGPAFNNERLDVVSIETLCVERVLVV